MREILFRGKRIDNGKWVYGYYWTNEIGNHFIKAIKSKDDNFVSNPTTNDFEVNPETVGQCTGTKDKNEKKIFEGDILDDSESIIIVKFAYGEFIIKYKTLMGRWINYGTLFDYLDDYEVETVGNIYDNPELVKEVMK